MTRRAPGVVLFDLDGTLSDPEIGIVASVRYALSGMGRPVPPDAELRTWIGPPLHRSFRALGFTPDEVERAVALYRENFERSGLYQNVLYPGIDELLERLQVAGTLVALATSKPEVYARQVLEHLGIANCFDLVCGGDLRGDRVEKDRVVAVALERIAAGARRHAVMVGDRADDVRAARAAAIPSIGVTYGFGSYEELEDAGATWILRSVVELAGRLAG